MLCLESLSAFSRRQVESWPERDRIALLSARLSLAGRTRWGRALQAPRPTSLRNYIDGYTHWLRWLAAKGWLDEDAAPDERASLIRMEQFVSDSLAAGLRPITVRNNVVRAWRVLQMLVPEKNQRSLLAVLGRLKTRTIRDKSHLPKIEDLLLAGRRVMAHAREREPNLQEAARFRTGLQIVFLGQFGLRLTNLASLEIGRHLCRSRNSGFEWWIQIEGEETKNGRSIDKPVPADVAVELDEYCKVYRPILCLGRYGTINPSPGNRLWVSSRGGPQLQNSIYKRVKKAIKTELDIDVCPHQFRDAIATSIARQDPAHASRASLRLGNTEEVIARHYRHASTLAASELVARKLNSIVHREPG